MNATTLSVPSGIAGADLEAELAQPRTHDRDVAEAAASGRTERAGTTPPASRTPRAPRTTPSQDPAVELRGVGKRYGDRSVLTDFDLSIERGSFVAIVGRSGCGKSTLLRLVAGLERPTTGALLKQSRDGAPLDTRIMFQGRRVCCPGRPFCKT